MISTRTFAYHWVKNVRFSENLACFVFLKHPFWDLPFCLITDDFAFIFSECITIPSKHLLVLKKSCRRLQDMSWRRLQHVFSVTTFRLPSLLEDVLKISRKTSWKLLEDVLEDEKWLRWRHFQDILKTYLEDVLKTCLGDIFKTSWRQTKCSLGISVSSKSKCVSNKSTSEKSKSNRKCNN